jgi:hypothetical protein
MSENQNNDELIQQLVYGVLELQGLQSANATILHSLLSIVCENAPALIEPIKEKITDVADLKLKMNEVTSSISITAFENEIKRAILQFDLIKESSQYSYTFIDVKDKK